MRWKLKKRMASPSPDDGQPDRKPRPVRFTCRGAFLHTSSVPTSRAALWTAIALAALTACSGHTGRVAARRVDRGTTTSSEDPTTTTARATTTTARKDPPRPLPGLGLGASGPQVLPL